MRLPKQASKRALSVLNRREIEGQRLCKSFHIKRTGTVETSYLLGACRGIRLKVPQNWQDRE